MFFKCLMRIMDLFTVQVKNRLAQIGPQNKVYLKSNYEYELFSRHNILDDEINLLFDPKKIQRIYPNIAFEERIDVEINISKKRLIKVIIQFDPFVNGVKQEGKVGIVTAFVL